MAQLKTALLLGGSGFIGQALARALHKTGVRIRILDALPPPNTDSPLDFIQGSYNELPCLQTALKGCDYVVHLVHTRIHRATDAGLAQDIQENLLPSIQLFDACANEKIEKLIYVSSGGTVYGASDKPLLSEKENLQPLSPYGVLKACGEHYARLFFEQRGLPVIIARPSNAYGPGQHPFRGQGFVATALASALVGRPLSIFGDLSVERDYIYIDDLARALLLLLERGKNGEIYNLASGQGHSLQQILHEHLQPLLAKEQMHLKLEKHPTRGIDVPRNILDSSKLRAQTGWKPDYSLSQGLAETWQWLKRQHTAGKLSL